MSSITSIQISTTLIDLFIRLISKIQPKLKRFFTLVKPKTVLYLWDKRLKNYWIHQTKTTRRGCPHISQKIRKLVLELKSRKIVKFGITINPTISFVRNQLGGFMFDREDRKSYLIHDNSGEFLHHFIAFSKMQLCRLIKEYVYYFNHLRSHQGIGNIIPDGFVPSNNGDIVSRPVLFGTCIHIIIVKLLKSTSFSTVSKFFHSKGKLCP